MKSQILVIRGHIEDLHDQITEFLFHRVKELTDIRYEEWFGKAYACELNKVCARGPKRKHYIVYTSAKEVWEQEIDYMRDMDDFCRRNDGDYEFVSDEPPAVMPKFDENINFPIVAREFSYLFDPKKIQIDTRLVSLIEYEDNF